MASTRLRVERTAWVALTAIPLAWALMCVAIFISAMRSTENTDGPGMAMFSALVTGVPALGIFALLLCITVMRWNPPTIRAGWYVDPVGESWYRYWDGRAWTPQVAPPTAQ